MTATMSTEETIVLVAITRKGAAQAARLAALLPQAQILVSEKFADAFAGLPNPLASCRSAPQSSPLPLGGEGLGERVDGVSGKAMPAEQAPLSLSPDPSPASGRGENCDPAPLQPQTLSEWIAPLFAQYREIGF